MGIPKTVMQRLHDHYMRELDIDQIMPDYRKDMTDTQAYTFRSVNLKIILDCLEELGYHIEPALTVVE